MATDLLSQEDTTIYCIIALVFFVCPGGSAVSILPQEGTSRPVLVVRLVNLWCRLRVQEVRVDTVQLSVAPVCLLGTGGSSPLGRLVCSGGGDAVRRMCIGCIRLSSGPCREA